ncbi:DUF1515 family protein [Phyllobacterium endophyticum]|uniref:DUF1515 family protein n=1 Tax=Phyllobacterium endophyticum TaxID=1149773 RepID=UPI0016508A75|nr:DUF1515 family protein [Phyllobacterium endophyticum]
MIPSAFDLFIRIVKAAWCQLSLNGRMDGIVLGASDIKTDIATITGQVADSKVVTDEVRKWKLMGIGARGVVG